MEGLVQIAYYFDSTTAEIERAKLESAGIPAAVFVEDLGRQGPAQGRLMVPASAVEEACELLELDRPETPAIDDWSWQTTVLIVVGIALVALISVWLRT